MKLIAFSFLLSATFAFSQTGLIAHKSHSGTAATFAFADPGNFGAPPTTPPSFFSFDGRSVGEAGYPYKVIQLNDSTHVLIRRFETDSLNQIAIDTIVNHPLYSNPDMTIDFMRRHSHANAFFVNFDQKRGFSITESKEAIDLELRQKRIVEPNDEKVLLPTGSRPKKYGSWWLFFVGGGIFVFIVLVSGKSESRSLSSSSETRS